MTQPITLYPTADELLIIKEAEDAILSIRCLEDPDPDQWDTVAQHEADLAALFLELMRRPLPTAPQPNYVQWYTPFLSAGEPTPFMIGATRDADGWRSFAALEADSTNCLFLTNPRLSEFNAVNDMVGFLNWILQGARQQPTNPFAILLATEALIARDAAQQQDAQTIPCPTCQAPLVLATSDMDQDRSVTATYSCHNCGAELNLWIPPYDADDEDDEDAFDYDDEILTPA